MPAKEHTARCDVYAFGANDESQLGNGRKQEKEFVPSRAIKNAGFQKMTIAGGSKHTLLQSNHGHIFAAGLNDQGQIGCYGTRFDSQAEDFITSISKQRNHDQFALKSVGAELCAATWDTSAYVMNVHFPGNAAHSLVFTEGKGAHGELGRGTQTSTGGTHADSSTGDAKLTPLQPPFPTIVTSFAGGHSHYVAVLENGQVWGWGKANKGQLGDDENSARTAYIDRPKQLQGVDFKACRVVCGKEFTYIVGDPDSGRHKILGLDKNGLISKMPERVVHWKQIHATWNAIYVLYRDGVLEAWGKEFLYRLVPPGLPPIERIAVGSEHILALTRASDTVPSKLISWGWGEHGNCGDVSQMEPLPEAPRLCVSGRWNEIKIPGKILEIGAAQATSFVLTEVQQSPYHEAGL